MNRIVRTLVMLAFAGAALAQSAPATVADTAKGKALVDAKGMTLYTFERDTAGKSNCSGACLSNWPAFEAPADAKPAGEWTIIDRADGKRQWAHQGKALYRWKDDQKPGDATGDGVNNVWHIARP
jgi:predicted lipoprotein with Yx(FWY)xxD motif